VLESAVNGVTTWRAPLPVRSRALFTLSPAEGMEVLAPDGERVTFRRSPGADASWRWTTESVSVSLPSAAPPVGYTMRYPTANERSKRLNRAWSGAATDLDFAHTSVQEGSAAHDGLLLPAPATAAWDVDVPAAAELVLTPTLVAPEVLDGPTSDGARLAVDVEVGGQTKTIATYALSGPSQVVRRVDLSAWAGQRVRLRLRSEPGASAERDYVFVGEPAIVSRAAKPKRVVLVFIDTLRRDHMGLYGYARDTTPELDAWSKQAVVFDQARSVAPWTLPSARTMLTGRQPEHFQDGGTLPGRLAAKGWSTAMFAGNVYLGANFDLHRDWGTHVATNWPSAQAQVDTALKWLDDQDGRDAFVLVHFMDAHLPYEEPARFRRRYAGDAVAPLGEDFQRRAVPEAPNDAQRRYIVDRYDNNIAYVDEQVGRLLKAVGDDATVMVLADHGEEFWDHGGYEHGHALWDELLRVPLLLRAPGLAPGRVDAPVSLVDVAPTLTDLAGVGVAEDVAGWSLVAVATGSPQARDALVARDQAFGRPLYGRSRWGVLHEGQKYTTTEGYEQLFDLAANPDERDDLLRGEPATFAEPWRERLGAALGLDTPMGYRLLLGGARAPLERPVSVTVDVPGGVRAVWAGEDPLQRSEASVAVDGDRVTLTWERGTTNAREVFFAPKAPLDELTHRLAFTVSDGLRSQVHCVPGTAPAAPGASRERLLALHVAGRELALTWGVFPNSDQRGAALDATDDENRDALKALGYLDDSAPAEAAPLPSFTTPCDAARPPLGAE